jgi:hypothetical protein
MVENDLDKIPLDSREGEEQNFTVNKGGFIMQIKSPRYSLVFALKRINGKSIWACSLFSGA